MNKVVLLILIGTLAFLTEGCSYFSKFADARKELEESSTKPIPAKVNTAQATPQKTNEEVFADLEDEEAVEDLPEIVGLIPATDPDVRVRSIVRGRNDPFDIVTLNPHLEIEELPPEVVPGIGRQQNDNRTQNRVDEDQIDLPILEEVIEPTLAQDVVIFGLLETDNSTKLIVQAPEEHSSRYVEVGQYLSNGQVLVKSIDKDHFPAPMIILEQSGIEVAKTIGEDLIDSDEIGSLPTEIPGYDRQSAVSLK